jgi:hypothetical protein
MCGFASQKSQEAIHWTKSCLHMAGTSILLLSSWNAIPQTPACNFMTKISSQACSERSLCVVVVKWPYVNFTCAGVHPPAEKADPPALGEKGERSPWPDVKKIHWLRSISLTQLVD